VNSRVASAVAIARDPFPSKKLTGECQDRSGDM